MKAFELCYHVTPFEFSFRKTLDALMIVQWALTDQTFPQNNELDPAPLGNINGFLWISVDAPCSKILPAPLSRV